MQSGSWRNQAGPSHSQPHPSDAASPSSSSSHATPVPGHLGREAIQQQQLLLLQQQQLAQRQAFEQQEPQKQVARIEQHYAQNPVHQAFLQYALQTSQNRPSENIMNQQGKMSTASSGNQGDHFSHTERQLELGNIVSGQRNDPKPSEIAAGQLVPTNMVRPSQLRQSIITTQSNANNQFTMAQMQAMQLWDKEHNFDLTVPANLNLLAQVLPHWQSSRLAAIQKQSETCTTGQQPCLPSVKQSVISSSIENEGSAYVNSISDYSSQAGPSTCPQPVSSDIMTSGGETTAGKSNDLQTQARAHNRESENERAEKSQLITIDGGQIIHPPNSSSSMIMEQCYAKNAHAGNNSHQMQQLRSLQQLNRPMTQPEICSNDAVGGNQFPSQSGSAQVSNQQFGFTKQQLFLLKGQILAFRRLKCGERNLPPEVLRAIAGLPADSLPQQSLVQSGAGLQERTSAMEGMHTQMDEGLQPVLVSKDQNLPKEEPGTREEKAVTACQMPDVSCSAMEPLQSAFSAKIEESISPIIAEQETGKGNHNVHTKCDNCNEKGKAVSVEDASASTGQEKKPVFTSVCPSFTRKHDLLGSTTLTSNDMTLAYVVKDFLLDELNQQQQEIISSLCISEMFREISQSLKLLKDQCTYKKQIDRGGGDIEENKKENFKIRCAEFKKFLVQDRLDLLNTASIEELKGLKAIGKKRAEYILELRKEMSEPFKSIDDLREFGLSTKQINEMMAQALGDF